MELVPDSLLGRPTGTVCMGVRSVHRYTGIESGLFVGYPVGIAVEGIRSARRNTSIGPRLFVEESGEDRLYGGPGSSSEYGWRVRTLYRDIRQGSSVRGVLSTRRHTGTGFGLFVGLSGGDRPYEGLTGSLVR